MKLETEYAARKVAESEKSNVEKQKQDLEYELRHAREQMNAEKMQSAEMAAVSALASCLKLQRHTSLDINHLNFFPNSLLIYLNLSLTNHA